MRVQSMHRFRFATAALQNAFYGQSQTTHDISIERFNFYRYIQ